MWKAIGALVGLAITGGLFGPSGEATGHRTLAFLGRPGQTGARPPEFLRFSTFVGGNAADDCDAVAVDRTGAIYLGCHSASPDLPTPPGATYTIRGDFDAFVVKLTAEGDRVVYLTQLGGTDWESVQGIAVGDRGDVYVVGTTFSGDFPMTPGASQRAYRGGKGDAFVAHLDPAGRVGYATYLGSDGADDGRRIAADARGNAYVVGRAGSGFPTTNAAFQRTYAGGDTDAFVAKLDPSGALVYSTLLGGSESETGFAVAVDRSGAVVVTGQTKSSDFPTARALQAVNRGESDAFIAALDPDGSRLRFATYLGGPGWDEGSAIAFGDSAVFVAGSTRADGFPTSSRAFQTVYRGRADVFVAKLREDGSALVASTLLGGSGEDSPAQLVARDASGVCLVGSTESADFPVIDAAQPALLGTKDGVVACFDRALGALTFSTYLGGTNREQLEDAAPTRHGELVLTGVTTSTDFPTAAPLRRLHAGGLYDVVLARVRPRTR